MSDPTRQTPETTDAAAQASARRRKRIVGGVQLLLTVGAFTALLANANLPKLAHALRGAPLWGVPAATFTLLLILALATLRWRLLLHAYGARTQLGFLDLYRLQVIGAFYNMLPGAVGGDVVRAVVTRDAFGEQGIGSGLAVVLVERVIGLLGLFVLLTGVLALHPIPKLHIPGTYLVLAMLVCLGAVAAITVARRSAGLLPGKLGTLAASLPRLERPLPMIAALVVAVAIHALIGLLGQVMIAPFAPQLAMLDSLVMCPVAFTANFFPLTVAGAGTRDAAMIALYGLLGVPAEATLCASFEILAGYSLVAALGGTLSLTTKLDRNTAGKTQPPSAAV